jgi:cytochrome c5
VIVPSLRSKQVRIWLMTILCAMISSFAQSATSAPDARQSKLFVHNCAQCHARPETGAPFIGMEEDWREAVARGEDAMLINVVQGIRGMPPLGYCSACSEEDFRILIRMLAGTPDPLAEQR